MSNPLLDVLLALCVLSVIIRILRRAGLASRRGSSSYRRIKHWLKQKHGLKFGKDTDPGSIRMQLESVLRKERARLISEHEAKAANQAAKPRRRPHHKLRPFNADMLLKGFKAFIEKQDYAVLVE